jgi:hypothetical protein
MRIAVAALTAGMTMALAACGGGGAETGGTTAPATTSTTSTRPQGTTLDDQADVRETIAGLSEKADPDACTEAMTDRFVDASYPPAGPGAVDECRNAQKPGSKILAEDVRFGTIEIDGNEATATFAEIGPDVGGTRGRVRLLQDGAGVWRVDELLDLQIIDRRRFEVATRAGLTQGPGALHGDRAACVMDAVGRIPTPKLERLAESHEFPVPILADCLGGGSVRAAALAVVRAGLGDSRRYADHAGCAVRHLGRVLSADQARAYLGQEDRQLLQALVARALAACGAISPLGDGEQSVT